jgi:hypothetical protein
VEAGTYRLTKRVCRWRTWIMITDSINMPEKPRIGKLDYYHSYEIHVCKEMLVNEHIAFRICSCEVFQEQCFGLGDLRLWCGKDVRTETVPVLKRRYSRHKFPDLPSAARDIWARMFSRGLQARVNLPIEFRGLNLDFGWQCAES